MSEWKEVRIKNSSIEIIDGDRSSKYPKREEFLNEGVIFLNAASISGNCLKIENSILIGSSKRIVNNSFAKSLIVSNKEIIL